MSEMKEMILDVVEKMFKDHINKETVDLVENGDWGKSVWQILTENEIQNVSVSESFGGAGGDLDDLLSLYYLIGKYAAPIPFVETTLANYLLESLNLSITKNKITYTLPQDTVHLNDNDTISGRLTNVAWARHVDELLLFTNNAQGLVAVHLSLNNAVITPGTNLAGEPRDHILFDNVKIIKKSTPLNKDQLKFIQTLDTAAKNALMCGTIEKIFELTVQYSKEREQFGRPIHRFQLVQQHLAILAGEQAIASSSFENMVTALLSKDAQQEVAYTRIRLDEATKVVSTVAHQTHAAIGVTHEHSLHQYTRRLWSWRDEGLTVNYWEDIIAEALYSSETNLWSFLTDTKIVQPN